MTNITDLPQYVNFSKLQEFNESMPLPDDFSFSSTIDSIFGVFAQYPIIQWFLCIIVFFALFKLLRDQTYLNLSDTQVVTLSSFVVVAMNTLLLIFEKFTSLQPLELFFVIWLVGVIMIFGKKR